MENLLFRCLEQTKKGVKAMYFTVIDGKWCTSYKEGPVNKVFSFDKVYKHRPITIWDDGQNIGRFTENQLKELLRA